MGVFSKLRGAFRRSNGIEEPEREKVVEVDGVAVTVTVEVDDSDDLTDEQLELELDLALDRITPAPFMETPDIDVSGLPFDNRPYSTYVRMGATDDGEVFEAERRWYADDCTMDAFVCSLPELLILMPEELGAHVERDWMHGVAEPPSRMWDFPEEAAWLVRHPPTPTGRRARYPWGIAFNASESASERFHALDFDSQLKAMRGGLCSVWGNIDYLADGRVGRADLVHEREYVVTDVRIRRVAGSLTVTKVGQQDYKEEPWWNPPKDGQ